MFSKNQPLPDWAVQANKTHVPDYAKDASAVILYDEYVETIDANGRATEREREAIRILKPQGRHNGCAVGYDVDESDLSEVDQFEYYQAQVINPQVVGPRPPMAPTPPVSPRWRRPTLSR